MAYDSTWAALLRGTMRGPPRYRCPDPRCNDPLRLKAHPGVCRGCWRRKKNLEGDRRTQRARGVCACGRVLLRIYRNRGNPPLCGGCFRARPAGKPVPPLVNLHEYPPQGELGKAELAKYPPAG